MTQLTIYNGALMLLDERSLATITDNVETRRKLDSVWDRGGVDFCLEQGQWNFAMNSAELDASTSLSTDFGYANVFEKPDNIIRVCAVCSDEYFKMPLLQYRDETGYFYADIDPIYVRYVSNHADYGLDYTLWPETFNRYVEAYFAWMIAPSSKKTGQFEIMKMYLKNARSNDAMVDPTKFLPQGMWNSVRGGGSGRDIGNRGQLIG